MVARIRPFATELSNTASDPDPNNWPNLRQARVPLDRAAMSYGSFTAQRFALHSLYRTAKRFDSETQETVSEFEPIPEMRGQEFQLSWNLPETIWRPIDPVPTHYDEEVIFSVVDPNDNSKRRQAFIRPDWISRCAYLVDHGSVTPEALALTLIENEHNPDLTLDELITLAQSRSKP
jgi:hypothetical protein